MDNTAERSPKKRGRLVVRLLICLVIIGLAGVSLFFYSKYQEVLNAPSPAQELVNRLGPVIDLPSETPTLLTIADKSKLSNQTLAAQVQDGDQLLVFSASKKIIVFRPAIQKAVAILSIQAQVGPEEAVTTPQKVAP